MKAPTDPSQITQAKRNAAVAQARVHTTVGALKQRLNPRNIAADAREKVREKTGAISDRASGMVQQQPKATSAVAGVAALIIFRKPVGRLLKRLFRRKPKQSDTSETQAAEPASAKQE